MYNLFGEGACVFKFPQSQGSQGYSLGATRWWLMIVGEGEGRVKQETHCLVLYANVYRCGANNDVGGGDSQQDDLLERCLDILLIASNGGEKTKRGNKWEKSFY